MAVPQQLQAKDKRVSLSMVEITDPTVLGPIYDRNQVRWMDTEASLLRDLYAAGFSTEQIGKWLGRGQGSVISRRSPCTEKFWPTMRTGELTDIWDKLKSINRCVLLGLRVRGSSLVVVVGYACDDMEACTLLSKPSFGSKMRDRLYGIVGNTFVLCNDVFESHELSYKKAQLVLIKEKAREVGLSEPDLGLLISIGGVRFLMDEKKAVSTRGRTIATLDSRRATRIEPADLMTVDKEIHRIRTQIEKLRNMRADICHERGLLQADVIDPLKLSVQDTVERMVNKERRMHDLGITIPAIDGYLADLERELLGKEQAAIKEEQKRQEVEAKEQRSKFDGVMKVANEAVEAFAGKMKELRDRLL